jgi:hypothetical protein
MYYVMSPHAARGGSPCAYCSRQSLWLAFVDDPDGRCWESLCRPGEGCAEGSEGPFWDVGTLARDAGVPVAVAVRRISRGTIRREVVFSARRSLGGNGTPRATVDGVTRTLAEWASITGILYQTLRKRQRSGATGADLLAPVRGPIERIAIDAPSRDKARTA